MLKIGIIVETLSAIILCIFLALILFVLAINVESIPLAMFYGLLGVFILNYMYTYSIQGLIKNFSF